MVDFLQDFSAQNELVPTPKFQPLQPQPDSMGQTVDLPDFKMDYSALDPLLAPQPKIDMSQFIAPVVAPRPGREAVGSPNPADYSLDSLDYLPSASIQASEMINGKGTITQQFGNPNAGLYGTKNGQAVKHRGLDIAVKRGTPVATPKEGNWVVNKTGNDAKGYGNYVQMLNADTGETIQYSHLDKVLVKPGQRVTGAVVGLSGSTGRSTGDHVDIEYTRNGQLQNILTSPYRQYLGLNSTEKKQGAKGGKVVDAIKGWMNKPSNQFMQGLGENVKANVNLIRETLKAYGQGSEQAKNDLMPPDLYDPMVTGGIVGSVSPIDRASKLIEAANVAQKGVNLPARLAAIDKIKAEATENLTPQELEKVKDFADDKVVKKVHERLLNQAKGYDDYVAKQVDDMPNLLKETSENNSVKAPLQEASQRLAKLKK